MWICPAVRAALQESPAMHLLMVLGLLAGGMKSEDSFATSYSSGTYGTVCSPKAQFGANPEVYTLWKKA